jgi:hypothetical protein
MYTAPKEDTANEFQEKQAGAEAWGRAIGKGQETPRKLSTDSRRAGL